LTYVPIVYESPNARKEAFVFIKDSTAKRVNNPPQEAKSLI